MGIWEENEYKSVRKVSEMEEVCSISGGGDQRKTCTKNMVIYVY